MVSRIGSHIYAEDAKAAVELYKEAYGLIEKGEPWLDEDGFIIHHNLWLKNGELFLSVSESKHLPNDSFIEVFSTNNNLSMLFFVFFSDELEFNNAYSVLTKDAKLIREIESEGTDLVCEIVDKYGVFWHLRVPTDRNKVTEHFHTIV